MDNQASEFLKFQINRKIVDLFKSFLVLLEDMKDDEFNISDAYFQKMRKKVLSNGNDCIRELEDYLNKFEVEFKNKQN